MTVREVFYVAQVTERVPAQPVVTEIIELAVPTGPVPTPVAERIQQVPVVEIAAGLGRPGADGADGVGIPEVFVDGVPAVLNFTPVGGGQYRMEVTV